MQRTLKCPKCRARCVSPVTKPHRNPSTICIADYKSDGKLMDLKDEDFKLRIWSYMKPPKISEQIPSVNPERLEVVRKMLDETGRVGPTKVQVDSNINLELLPDGSVRKTLFRVEKRTYPPTSGSIFQIEHHKPKTDTPDLSFEIKERMSSTKY